MRLRAERLALSVPSVAKKERVRFLLSVVVSVSVYVAVVPISYRRLFVPPIQETLEGVQDGGPGGPDDIHLREAFSGEATAT